MKKLTSRKLAGAIAAMLCNLGVVLGAAAIGDVDKDIVLSAMIAITGLGGYQMLRQGNIDDIGG